MSQQLVHPQSRRRAGGAQRAPRALDGARARGRALRGLRHQRARREQQPGQPNAMYHGEDAQEDFLVLDGECIVIVEDEEHQLRPWDLVHCPRGTRHVFVGAGDGPCAILMVGARRGEKCEYPPSEAAARYGAAAEVPRTPIPDFEMTRTTFSWPPER